MNPTLPCLEDERSLAGKLAEPLPPLCQFDLAGWGIDPESFLRDLAPTFDALAWDHYDVRAAQLRLLARHHPEQASVRGLARLYYSGRGGHEEILGLARRLPADVRQAFDQIQPFRQRAAAAFAVAYDAGGRPRIQRVPLAGFSQDVGAGDVRSQERVFPEAAGGVVAHPGLRQLLGRVAQAVRAAEGGLAAARVVLHQVRTVVRPGPPTVVPPGEPTQVVPEGIHQDGARYIVSALVVEREGVSGGESVVYGPDKETVLLAAVLKPGQGIFQADTGSPLWHYVSPIAFDSGGGRAEGRRGIFGFDIHVTAG